MGRHETISKSRWEETQRWQADYWHGAAHFDSQCSAGSGYLPLLQRFAAEVPADGCVMEIGCGPVCLAREIAQGRKIYVDPLIELYRRSYPGKLPKGESLNAMAESIPKPDASCDMILCLNTINYVLNPELAIDEMERLLKPGGILALSLTTFPPLVARVRYFIERFLPPLRTDSCPYYYTRAGIERTLLRHFDIVESQRIEGLFLDHISNQNMLYICRQRTGPHR